MKISYKEFLPEVTIEGKRGFYPAMTREEWDAIPLPMKCATWDASVKSVIFDTFFSDYGVKGKVEVYTAEAFKALFRYSESDTQLYSICAVRLRDGKEIAAKWIQDTTSGAFRIITPISQKTLGTQGGFRGHVPANCKKREDGTWGLYPVDNSEDTSVYATF